MITTGTALRLTVIVGESDQFHRRPVYTEIVHRAHAAGLAGATVVRGCEGFGATTLIHTTRILSLAEELPVVVIVVDEPDKIRAFLPQLHDLVDGGLAMLDEVEIVRHVSHGSQDASGQR